ncbi:MAG: cell division protein FtsQ/DivIB [Pararhodobacter sp.]
MSALIRDPLAKPPAQRPAEPSRWNWPDRQEVTPPPVPAGRPLRSRPGSVAPLWPAGMPDRAWPPLPDSDRRAATGLVPDPALDDEAAWDLYGPDEAETVTSFRPQPQVVAGQPAPAETGRQAAAAPAVTSFTAAGSTTAAFDWTAPEWTTPDGNTPDRAAPAPAAPRQHDPSPSRLAYRLNRLWLTPAVRVFVRMGLPMLFLAVAVGGWTAQEANRVALAAWGASVIEAVQNQPMFQVGGIEVISATPEVAEGVEALLGLSFPVSSWDLDLVALRAHAETLDAVQGAWLQIRSGGVLELRINERIPAMIWRHPGGLDLIDPTGHRVARLANRTARADLPLIAGAGAPEAIAEAQALWAAAAPIHARIRGFVRMGERRWDVVLDRNQRILLPATGAVEALERVVAMTEGTQQLLSRDVAIVDMRNPARPTLRLSPDAMAELTRNRSIARGVTTR